MGWVGVATLIATACYVLYRFPPHTWSSEPASAPPESIPEQAPTQNNARTTDTSKPPAIPKIEPVPAKESEEENAEEQSTPKASASAPMLEVPVLDLHDSAAESGSAKSPASLNHNNASPSSLYTTSASTVARQAATMPPRPLPPTLSPSSTLSPQPSQADSSSLMPPPPLPRNRATGQQQQQPQTQPSQPQFLSPGPVPGRYPPRLNNSSLVPPPSAAASQRGPQRLAPPTNSLAPPARPSSNSSKRAVLEPGFSPLDWAALTSNPKANLRGENLPAQLIRVTPSMLKIQNGRKGRDAWTSYQGKVYNIQPYVPFHPGGKGELLRGAGKDSAKLFVEVHPWVNWDAILGECLVGILVSESEVGEGNALDAMD